MQKTQTKKSILFIILIVTNILAAADFYYKSITNNIPNNEYTITLEFNTAKNIYIDSQSINCYTALKDTGKITCPKSVGNIFLKNNKTSFEALSGSGEISCSFNNTQQSASTLTLEYRIFDAKKNILTNETKTINIPPVTKKNSELKNQEKPTSEKAETKKTNNSSFLNNILDKTKNSHFLLIAFITFILGILMSLTPCIYPMIPITISILGIDKKSFSARLYSGILYMLGISLTFSMLGMLAASGKLFFGQLLAMPIFTIITTCILFFMTLQMLGLIDSIISINSNFKMPKCLENNTYLPFFYGIFSGTITSPCVSPGLVAILSLVGQQSNIFIGWLWLFTFGMGLALPLLLIALVMNSAFIFPKSGTWMNELKEIIGLILIYILNTNIARLINENIAFIISISIILVFLLYKHHPRYNTQNSNNYWFFSFSSMIAILFLLSFGFSFYQKHISKKEQIQKQEIYWLSSFDEAMIKGVAENKLILIDFTADWCSICQVVDKELFKDISFMNTLNNFYLFCKIDCSQSDSAQESLLKKYKINGFPTILIIDPKTKSVIDRYSGEILDISKSDFITLSKAMHKKYNE
jgi:thiol:disulfide interchange protein